MMLQTESNDVSIPVSFIRLNPVATLPAYQTPGAAAADIYACLDGPIVLEPMGRCIVPTGISVAIPSGYEIQVRARSGLSSKYGISLANGIGTIDSDYRGEVGVILINLGEDPFTIEPGMRVAQMVLAKCERISWQEATILPESDRGVGGYGSTG